MHCIEAGLPPTTVNLAKQCGISRVAIWKLQRRWPWLDAWCDEVLIQSNAHYWGAIERRMALTALQGGGSPQHAEMFCKMRANTFARRDPDAPGLPISGGHAIFNFLVPQPPAEMEALQHPVAGGRLEERVAIDVTTLPAPREIPTIQVP